MSGIRRRTALLLSGVVPIVLVAVAVAFATPAASTSTVLAGDPSPLPRGTTTSTTAPPTETTTVTSPASSSVGSTSATPPPPAPATTTSTTLPTGPCRARDLTGRIDSPPARFTAAGHRGFLVVLTNAGGTPCSVLGFGTYSLLDSGSLPMRGAQHNTVWSTVDSVVLGPGGQAYARVSYGVVPTGDEPESGPCQPPSAALRVVPPGDTGALDLPFAVSVCDHGRLDVTEFAGSDVF
ncbi:DUF4232 domain-containing protein [Umezawaea sp. NPDC059074]|uniref:DUF4232 domain-containing protein n=1 Tax=Umezawaea sp. NPDC059074 TaxID=3346716 RepID=UPI0036A807D2